ncbi:LacI family DNA-binding transcriptional regulator [Robertmurraya massiliosenegalensis]|uniref:LacI family DNA-binding transcriptional regulator n=1 Tax=Robertmurraya TaxID=2837507 RepID=UPI0039A44029
MKPTIKDVARLSGVSMSTVSRVLNSPESVREDKRIKVQKIIEELKYHPNALARGLISKRTQSLGVLIPDISNLYVSEIMKGMEDAAHNLGLNLILCNTDRNQEKMIRYLKVLKEKQVDGIIFTSEPITEAVFQIFDQLNIPIVLAATQSIEYNIPSVKIDDEKAGYDAACYLMDQGHVDIGMISGPTTDVIAGFPRYFGFKQALKDRLGRSQIDKFIEFGAYQFEDGYKGMERLYLKNPHLTSVFCASDEMALGAISYLHKIGKEVPNDISILGFDNTKIAKMSIPQLTTVAQPMYEIGKFAVNKLECVINSEGLDEVRTYVKHTIIERESVKNNDSQIKEGM